MKTCSTVTTPAARSTSRRSSDPLFRAEPGPDGEDGDGGEARVELLDDRVDLLPRCEGLDVGRLRLRVLDVTRGVLSDPLPARRLLEHLAQRAEDVVTGALGQRLPPGGELVRLQRGDVALAEDGLGLP